MQRGAPKAHPRLETLAFIREGGTIEEAAKKQNKTVGTILTHLEDLRTEGLLNLRDVAHLKDGTEDGIEEIHSAMEKVGYEKLTPIFKRLGGAYTYDTIRLARLLFEIKE